MSEAAGHMGQLHRHEGMVHSHEHFHVTHNHSVEGSNISALATTTSITTLQSRTSMRHMKTR